MEDGALTVMVESQNLYIPVTSHIMGVHDFQVGYVLENKITITTNVSLSCDQLDVKLLICERSPKGISWEAQMLTGAVAD